MWRVGFNDENKKIFYEWYSKWINYKCVMKWFNETTKKEKQRGKKPCKTIQIKITLKLPEKCCGILKFLVQFKLNVLNIIIIVCKRM